MKTPTFHRLHSLRMDNDAAGYLLDEMRPRFDRLRDRHTNGVAPVALSAYQLFQTPAPLAVRMVELADIRPWHSVLEPEAGLGRILTPILAAGPDRVHACELSPELAGELFRQFPTVELSQGDFLGKHLGEFDRVIMNPPYHCKDDIRHIEHAMGHLPPGGGGVLVGLCLDTHHRETALRGQCDVWEKIPAGTFRAEGTNVATVLFRMKP